MGTEEAESEDMEEEMTLAEYADVLQVSINVERPFPQARWFCVLAGVNYKDDAEKPGDGRMLCGSGATPASAAEDLVNSIRGKVAVVKGIGGEFAVLGVPKTLERGTDIWDG